MIAVLDYKIGNIGSVSNMLRHIGVKHVVADSPEKLENADKIILPGIGSFDPCVKALRESGLLPTGLASCGGFYYRMPPFERDAY